MRTAERPLQRFSPPKPMRHAAAGIQAKAFYVRFALWMAHSEASSQAVHNCRMRCDAGGTESSMQRAARTMRCSMYRVRHSTQAYDALWLSPQRTAGLSRHKVVQQSDELQLRVFGQPTARRALTSEYCSMVRALSADIGRLQHSMVYQDPGCSERQPWPTLADRNRTASSPSHPIPSPSHRDLGIYFTHAGNPTLCCAGGVHAAQCDHE